MTHPDKLYNWQCSAIIEGIWWVIKSIRSGPHQIRSCGPHAVWPSFWLVLVSLICTCGSDLANKSGLPKCHQSTWYVGHMKVPGAVLLSGASPEHLLLHKKSKDDKSLCPKWGK